MLIRAKRRFLLPTGLLAWLLFPAAMLSQPAAPDPGSVVVVANRAMEGSLKVARAYMAMRSIPEANLIELETATEEQIPRQAYLDTIHNPLLQALIDRKLVDVFEGPTDDIGRRTVTVFTSKVRYMVLCYGVPTRVNELPGDQKAADEAFLQQFRRAQAVLYEQFTNGPMARSEASVDGELAVMLQRGLPLRGFIPNPLYRQKTPRALPELIRVTRLDGPSPQAVIRLLENTLSGEREGLRGRAYVDEDGRGGNYQMGNDWMARSANVFASLGFDLDHDTQRGTFQGQNRFDAPVLYAGWYAANCTGPFTLPGFRFPAGAVAVHLHSFSARDLRSGSKGWVGPFVERGVSATLGNVAEPYLTMTHNFDLFFAALAEGWTFGDAAYYALPGLSWQAVAVGDPLYRPFAVPLEKQLETIADPLKILENQYVAIREINRLEAAGDSQAARQQAGRAMRSTPGPALALRRAQLLAAAGDKERALGSLSMLSQLSFSSSMDWGLFAEIADTLNSRGDARSGLAIYRQLEGQTMADSLKNGFLKRGISVAQAAGEPGLAIEWQARVAPPQQNKADKSPAGQENPGNKN